MPQLHNNGYVSYFSLVEPLILAIGNMLLLKLPVRSQIFDSRSAIMLKEMDASEGRFQSCIKWQLKHHVDFQSPLCPTFFSGVAYSILQYVNQ